MMSLMLKAKSTSNSEQLFKDLNFFCKFWAVMDFENSRKMKSFSLRMCAANDFHRIVLKAAGYELAKAI